MSESHSSAEKRDTTFATLDDAKELAADNYRRWQFERLTRNRVRRMEAKGDRYSHPTRKLTDQEIYTAGYLAALGLMELP